MQGWLRLPNDTYVKPIDAGSMYVVQEAADNTTYDCWRMTAAGSKDLVGNGASPRLAARLISGWVPTPRKAHLKKSQQDREREQRATEAATERAAAQLRAARERANRQVEEMAAEVPRRRRTPEGGISFSGSVPTNITYTVQGSGGTEQWVVDANTAIINSMPRTVTYDGTGTPVSDYMRSAFIDTCPCQQCNAVRLERGERQI